MAGEAGGQVYRPPLFRGQEGRPQLYSTPHHRRRISEPGGGAGGDGAPGTKATATVAFFARIDW